MADDVLTRNGDGELAVRTVQSTGDNYVNPNDVYTRDNDGKLCVRTIGNGGDSHNKGYYATPEALRTAYPTAEAGDFAIVESTDTIWIWDTDNSEWVDSHKTDSVTSVNGKTGAVVLNAEDVGALPDDTPIPAPQVNSDWNATSGVAEILNKPTIPSTAQQVGAVPQYTTMPTASASNLGEVAQYAGVEVPDVPASATITQTVGSGLTDLAVNVETFESGENPSGDTTVDFVANVTPNTTDWLVNSGSFSISGDLTNILTIYGWEVNMSGVIYFDSADRCYIGDEIGSSWFYTSPSQLAENGVTITGEIESGDYGSFSRTLGSTTWEKDGATVDLANYGITFTGTPANNDTLEVDYSAFVKGRTNGYFYKSEATYTDPVATISQTAGSSLTDLSVDVDLFVAEEQPSGDESVEFVANVNTENASLGAQVGTFVCNLNSAEFLARLVATWGNEWWNATGTKNFYFVYTDSGWALSSQDGPTTISDPGVSVKSYNVANTDWGFYVTDDSVVQVGDYVPVIYTESGTTWSKNGTTVDLSAYGISYSGTPVDDDTLTVVYTAPALSGYAWNQKNVQPAPETPSAGIDWKTKVDLPADFMSSDWSIYPVFRIAGGLPDGEYEMYLQAKKSNGNGNVWGLGTYVFRFSIDNTSRQYYGWFAPVMDGNWGGINDRIYADGSYLYSVFWTDNGDFIVYTSGEAFTTNIHGFFPNTAVPECFKLSAIKNIETGDEYVATGSLYNNDSLQTAWSGQLKCEPLQQSPDVPTYYSRITQNASETTALSISGVAYQSNRFDYVSELSISLSLGSDLFNATLKVCANSYELTVEDATGVFENTQVGRMPSYWDALYVKFNFPAGTTGTVNASVGWKGGSKDAGHYINGSTVDNTFVPLNVLKVGVTPASVNYLGKIMQYTGTTDANYTNGYFYKATGTIVTTPQSLTTTSVDPADVSVTIDVDNLIPAIQNQTGWTVESVKSNLNNNYQWQMRYDYDNATVMSLYWGAYGQFTDSSVLNCFTVSTTGSYTGESSVIFYATYTPESQTVSGGAWTRVDVQPSGSSLPTQTGHEGQFLFTNGSTASWRDNVYTNTTSETITFDENTTEYVFHITPKTNRDMFLNIMVYEGMDDGEGNIVKGQHQYNIKAKLSYKDISEDSINYSVIHTYQEDVCSMVCPNFAMDIENSRFDCGFMWMDDPEGIPAGEERYIIVDIEYSDGVNSITDEVGTLSGNSYDRVSGSMPTPTAMPDPSFANGAIPLFAGSVQWVPYPFGNVSLNEWTDYNTIVAENGSFVLKYYSQVSQMPTPVGEGGTIFADPDNPALFQYIGATDQDYTHGYFYEIYYVLDRNASASQTTGSSLSNFAVDAEICATWLRYTNVEQGTYTFTFDGTFWYGEMGGEFSTADLGTEVGITFTGTPVANDVITVAFDQATWGWEQVNTQPSVVEVLTQVSGYDATKTQTLKNVNGVFTWVDDPA